MNGLFPVQQEEVYGTAMEKRCDTAFKIQVPLEMFKE